MANELLSAVVHVNLAAAVAVLAVLALRGQVRRFFGPQIAYRLWAAVPVTAGAALIPAREARRIVAPGVDGHGDIVSIDGHLLSQAPAKPLLALWLVGAAIAAGIVAVRQLRFLSLARRGLVGPAIVGVLAPKIVMPADAAARYTPDERAIIRAHERTHIARRDPRTNGLIAVGQCLAWFNPLLHLAAQEARVDQEMACDAAVLAQMPGQKRRYAETLLKTQLGSVTAPLGCHWVASSSHPLEMRIAALRSPAPQAMRRDLGAAAMLLTVAAAGYAAWMAQPPAPAQGLPSWEIAGTSQSTPVLLIIIRRPR
jgi:beta-lactamase regulating signal transducer with metallopeptidase domain